VPTDADGYDAQPQDRLGLDAAEHARVTYDGVRVPRSNLIGEEAGDGFYQTRVARAGRVEIAAAHLGMAEGAFDRALAYAKEREQGGQTDRRVPGNAVETGGYAQTDRGRQLAGLSRRAPRRTG